MSNFRRVILAVVLTLIVGAIFYLESSGPERAASPKESEISIDLISKSEKANLYDTAKEISTPDGFINTEPITISELIGEKVILVDFWTYSCINCQRTLPFLNSWHEKYNDKGLVIIGVHTPEFEFEKDYENVLRAVEKFGVKHPVVLDNDYSTWTAYKNQYWPRKYLIDIDGFIVYDHIGEGAYEETERKIQELLTERAMVLGENGGMVNEISGIELVSDDRPRQVGSPEIYFGSARNEYLGNGAPGESGVGNFTLPAEGFANTLYLEGRWNVQSEYAENESANARIIFRYRAKDVFFVASASEAVKVRVFLDGEPVDSGRAGEDVFVGDGESYFTVEPDQLYRVIEDSAPGEHTLEMIIENPGLKAFTFTFG